MSGRQATVVAILAVILAACSAEVKVTPSSPVSPSPSHGPSSLATVSPAPTTVALMPAPSATATPTPTQKPLPSKPTGVKFTSEEEYICDDPSNPEFLCESAGFEYTVSWKEPPTEGVEIRVYGVTTCFRTDNPDGHCLREHTALPDGIRVLLAKGPASKGKLSFHGWPIYGTEEVCAYGYGYGSDAETDPPFYSVVVAAYDASGHSIFAIADAGRHEAGECGVETD
jgi:hypothetical protein